MERVEGKVGVLHRRIERGILDPSKIHIESRIYL